MNISIIKGLRNSLGVFIIGSAVAFTPAPAKAQTIILQKDTFEYEEKIPPEGTTSAKVLDSAPNPKVEINGISQNAVIVVDISKNILYQYDKNGNPVGAFSVASGKNSSPTHTGIRMVSHVETYPYRRAPRSTKRRRQPRSFGPNAIILRKVDSSTGETSQTGEFIHGNNNPESIGKYVSHGCIRMDNEVIKRLSKQVKRGDIILIIK